ncbi:MAG: hypothetical protein Q9209_000938 [Squamulea sp. 1 TL-2023]
MTNRGTAYILYANTADAESAIAHMHEAQLDGALISVSIVLPRRKFSRSPPPARRDAPPFDRFDGRGPPPGPYRGGPPPSEAPLLGDTVVDQLFLEIAMSMFTDHALIQDQDQGHTRHDHAVLRQDEEVEATGIGKRPHHLLEAEEEEGVRAIRAIRATATVVAAGIEVGAGTEEIDRNIEKTRAKMENYMYDVLWLD